MLIATIRKDLLLLARDRGALASLFLMPVVFIAVFGAIFGGGDDTRRTRLALHAAAGDPRVDAVVAILRAHPMFEVEDHPDEASVARAAIDADVAGVVLHEGLGAEVPAVLYLDPGASPQVRAPIEGTLRGVVQSVVHGISPTETLVEVRAPPGRDVLAGVTGFQITVPANAVLFGFFLALTVALSFVEERRTGTWRRLLAAPVSRWMILVAKLVPFFLVGLIQFAFLFGVGVVGFGMDIAGSPAALVAMTVAVVLCATTVGLFIASLGGSEKQVGSMGSISILVMGLLGGCMVPRVIMPPVMQTIGLLVPHGWALDGYFDVLVRPGTDVAAIAPQLAALLGFSAVFLALGAALFRFERS